MDGKDNLVKTIQEKINNILKLKDEPQLVVKYHLVEMVTHTAIGKANSGVQRKIPFKHTFNTHKAQVKNYIYLITNFIK